MIMRTVVVAGAIFAGALASATVDAQQHAKTAAPAGHTAMKPLGSVKEVMQALTIPLSESVFKAGADAPKDAAEVAGLPELFGNGPLLRLQQRVLRVGTRPAGGRRRPIAVELWQWAAAVALIGWLPLLLLVVVAPAQPGALRSLLLDFGVHCRSLLAAPILVLAELISARLGEMAQHFTSGGLIAHHDQARFERALDSTRRLAHSSIADWAAAALAYPILFLLFAAGPLVPAWQRSGAGPLECSAAGWWHLLVSAPLLMLLLLGWFWRLLLWVRFLWSVSRLELVLSPAHPDRCGGLRFLGYSLSDFSALGLAFGTIVAGSLANQAVRGAVTLVEYRRDFLALALFVVILFGAPLLLFSGPLLRTLRRGVYRYGRLAASVGGQLEHKWLEQGAAVGEESLGVQDFSAVTDLYQIASNVYAMRLLAFDVRSVALLLVATVLPLLAVAAASLPLDVLRQVLSNLLF